MAVPATVKYFGRFPTTIVMQSSSSFDGTAQTGAAVITPGLYIFPSQAGGGLYNFHDHPVEVKQISVSGGGSVVVTQFVLDSAGATVASSVVATLSGNTDTFFNNLILVPNVILKFTGGSGTPKVTITASEAEFSHDGG